MRVRYCNQDGETHLHGSFLCGHETACGYVDTGNTYKDFDGIPDCAGCIDVAKTAVEGTTKAAIDKLKFKTKTQNSV